MRHSIFAMELCLLMPPDGTLRQDLVRLVSRHPQRSDPAQKWELYKRIAERLLQDLHLADQGCWDFFDDDAKARADHQMWSNGMITEEAVRPEPSGEGSDDDPRFMTYTMSFLIVQGAASERALARLCEIPQAKLWRRETFEHLLRGLRTLSFGSVVSDVSYVIPRDAPWGLTRQDLQDPKFHYLRKIV